MSTHLSVIDVADGSDVHMRLVAFEFVTGGSEGAACEVEAGGGVGAEETPDGGLGDGVEGSSRHAEWRSLLWILYTYINIDTNSTGVRRLSK